MLIAIGEVVDLRFQSDLKTTKRSAVAISSRTLVKVYENIYTIRTSTGRSIIGLVISYKYRKVTKTRTSSIKVDT